MLSAGAEALARVGGAGWCICRGEQVGVEHDLVLWVGLGDFGKS
jgi:hypothetical protein